MRPPPSKRQTVQMKTPPEDRPNRASPPSVPSRKAGASAIRRVASAM